MNDDLVAKNLELYSWKTAVIDALVVSHIYTKEHDNNPRKAINDLLSWEASVAEYFAHHKYKNAQMELDL